MVARRLEAGRKRKHVLLRVRMRLSRQLLRRLVGIFAWGGPQVTARPAPWEDYLAALALLAVVLAVLFSVEVPV